MSNRVSLIRTYFRDMNYGEEEPGFRIYDDYDQDYNNTIEPTSMSLKPLEFLTYIIQNGFISDRSGIMLDFAMDRGMYIDDEWFDAEKISECMRKASGE